MKRERSKAFYHGSIETLSGFHQFIPAVAKIVWKEKIRLFYNEITGENVHRLGIRQELFSARREADILQ